VSTSGSNGSGCGTSQSNACATPDYPFNNRAGAGDTVLVAAGVYNYGNSAMTLSASGTSSAWKLLTCETRHACKITNSSGSGNSTTSVVEAQYTRIDGFEVTSSATTGHPNGFFVTVPHVKFTRNHIHDLMGNCHTSGYQNGGGGIQTYDTGLGVYDYEIDSNLFHDFDWPNVQACSDQGSVQSDAMLLEYTSGQIKVTNNIVYHSAGGWGMGIGSAGDTSNVLVANNLIFNNANGGVFFVMESGSNIAVVNNIIANNGAYGSFTSNCGVAYPYGMTFDFHNNNMYNNAGGTYCAEWGSGNQALQTGDKSENPANSFVNWLANGGGDYHLKSTSTLLDAGTSSHNPPSIDYDGKARFTGSAMDIGPYEY
jgi:hypothetical protein